MSNELFRYDGKRALIVGAATGMGAATARAVAALGGDVIAVDVAAIDYPAKQTISANLSQRASVDAALAQINGPLHAVFLCAGVADGNPHIMAINFISQRYLLERLVERSALPRGSAVALISSVQTSWLETLNDAIRQAFQDRVFAVREALGELSRSEIEQLVVAKLATVPAIGALAPQGADRRLHPVQPRFVDDLAALPHRVPRRILARASDALDELRLGHAEPPRTDVERVEAAQVRH